MNLRRTFFENKHFSTKIREIEADSFFENDRLRPKLLHVRFARATVTGPPGSNRPATLFMLHLATVYFIRYFQFLRVYKRVLQRHACIMCFGTSAPPYSARGGRNFHFDSECRNFDCEHQLKFPDNSRLHTVRGVTFQNVRQIAPNLVQGKMQATFRF